MQYWTRWAPYVPVAQRRANALREMNKLRRKGRNIQPVAIEGRTIARSFWGKSWCDHLESFSDFDNRLPRGRTYVRNGSVCHLAIRTGRIEAIVSGSDLYNIRIRVQKLKPTKWKAIKKRCTGRIGSMLELLQGRLSDQVMGVVTDRADGMFPQPREIDFECDCPDWAVMCKHVAAVLYGVGARLDRQPELLFRLRGTDAEDLIGSDLTMPAATVSKDVIDVDRLGDIFNIELDKKSVAAVASRAKPKPRRQRKGATQQRKQSGNQPAPKNNGASSKRKRAAQPSRKGNPRKKPERGRGVGARRKPAPTREPARKATPAAVPKHRPRKTAPPGIRLRPTGKSIARLRKKLKLTVKDFAARLNVSATSVCRWEKTPGPVRLQALTLKSLARLHEWSTKRKQ